MKVLIFGGTTEGRQLAEMLSRRGVTAAVSVATPLGAEELGSLPGVTVLVGRLEAEEMAALLQGYDRCVDATHPYARIVSQNIRLACARTGVPLRRLLRPAGGAFRGVVTDSAQGAAAFLKGREGPVLLAIGAKELAAFSQLPPERLYPRVLPVVASLEACRAMGIPTRNILALHGPFSQALNRAILEQYHIRWFVTKDGGAEGGFQEKVAAAEEAGAELVVIRRPEERGSGLNQILNWLTEEKEAAE